MGLDQVMEVASAGSMLDVVVWENCLWYLIKGISYFPLGGLELMKPLFAWKWSKLERIRVVIDFKFLQGI